MRLKGFPAPLRTLLATWLAVSVCGALALLVQLVLWTLASPWHTLIVGVCAGAVVVVAVTVKQRRTPTRMRTREAVMLDRPPASGQPPAGLRATRTATRTARQPHQQQRQRVAYWQGVRVGVMDEQEHFRPDH